jgi:hypothetical protein
VSLIADHWPAFSMTAFAWLLVAHQGAQYYFQIKKVNVSPNARFILLKMTVALMLSITAIVISPVLAVIMPAVLSLSGSAAFLLMLATRRTPNRPIAVTVGQRCIDFSAKDSDNRDFTLSSTKGRPVLLKFYRGHW